MEQFWQKWHNSDIPIADLLWYLHDGFGDRACEAFTAWCLGQIRSSQLRVASYRSPPKSLISIIPKSLFDAQNAWRVLITGQLNNSSLPQHSRQEIARIAREIEGDAVPRVETM